MQSINGFHFEDEFCHFVNNELLPAAGSKAEFWDQFTSALQLAQPLPKTSQQSGGDVSLLNPRYALKAINARWGSLYSALYHENAIPHSAGLKTGQRFNVARASRVIDYSRKFLDAAFPLAEGSHQDAANYLVYFQNLMVTLADGSTVGLKNPGHFVAKSGPKDNPDTVFLKNSDVHVEIRFDQSGLVGAIDMANIEDILVEAPARTLLSCEADSVAEKCEVLRNLQSLIGGQLKAQFALQLQSTGECPAVRPATGNSVPAAIVDAALFSIIAGQHIDANVALMVSSAEMFELIAPVIEQLQTNERNYSPELIKNYQNSTKEPAQAADNAAQQMPCIRIAEEELKNTAVISKQNTAVLNAIQQSYLPH